MWLRTHRGGLVNLDNVAAIDAEEVHGDSSVHWSVKATLSNGSVRTIQSRFPDRDRALTFIDMLGFDVFEVNPEFHRILTAQEAF